MMMRLLEPLEKLIRYKVRRVAMSTLTKNEREGLEDVFLSIHTHQDKYQKIKDISSLIMSKSSSVSLPKLVKEAKVGLNETKFSHLLAFISKKKKNLSK